MNWNWDLSLPEKFMINVQYATVKYEITRKPMVLILPHKTSFWHFCQYGTLPGNVNMEVSFNIWNRNTFRITSLYALRVHWESIAVSKMKVVELNIFHSYIETTELITELVLLSDLKLCVKLELLRSSYFGCKSCFC